MLNTVMIILNKDDSFAPRTKINVHAIITTHDNGLILMKSYYNVVNVNRQHQIRNVNKYLEKSLI